MGLELESLCNKKFYINEQKAKEKIQKHEVLVERFELIKEWITKDIKEINNILPTAKLIISENEVTIRLLNKYGNYEDGFYINLRISPIEYFEIARTYNFTVRIDNFCSKSVDIKGIENKSKLYLYYKNLIRFYVSKAVDKYSNEFYKDSGILNFKV